ncbi:MAG: hypothetical protein EBV30_10410, partial [Actinobacteria bacterium]|nr:hypothetical protein [Actinomycetota bacterium]
MKRVRYSTWLRDFKPTTNSLAQRAPFGGTMYETYGDELEEIREAADKCENFSATNLLQAIRIISNFS